MFQVRHSNSPVLMVVGHLPYPPKHKSLVVLALLLQAVRQGQLHTLSSELLLSRILCFYGRFCTRNQSCMDSKLFFSLAPSATRSLRRSMPRAQFACHTCEVRRLARLSQIGVSVAFLSASRKIVAVLLLLYIHLLLILLKARTHLLKTHFSCQTGV